LAAALAMSGRTGETHDALARFMELPPGYSIEQARVTMPYMNELDFEFYFEGIRRAERRNPTETKAQE
jgi:hypothetical protein